MCIKVVKGSKGIYVRILLHLPHCSTRDNLSRSLYKFRSNLGMKERRYYVGDARFKVVTIFSLVSSSPGCVNRKEIKEELGLEMDDCDTTLIRAIPPIDPKV